ARAGCRPSRWPRWPGRSPRVRWGWPPTRASTWPRSMRRSRRSPWSGGTRSWSPSWTATWRGWIRTGRSRTRRRAGRCRSPPIPTAASRAGSSSTRWAGRSSRRRWSRWCRPTGRPVTTGPGPSSRATPWSPSATGCWLPAVCRCCARSSRRWWSPSTSTTWPTPRPARVPGGWAPAPRSPPPAPAGWPATVRSAGSCSAPTAPRWTWAAPTGWCPRICGGRTRPGTGTACSPAAEPRPSGATSTTWSTGSTAARRRWRTQRCCASGTRTLCAPRVPGGTPTRRPMAHLAPRRHRDPHRHTPARLRRSAAARGQRRRLHARRSEDAGRGVGPPARRLGRRGGRRAGRAARGAPPRRRRTQVTAGQGRPAGRQAGRRDPAGCYSMSSSWRPFVSRTNFATKKKERTANAV
ncbi:hypothetical protein SAMN05216574_107211, partial [Blastococcus tunisiensis]